MANMFIPVYFLHFSLILINLMAIVGFKNVDINTF